jgi:type II secretion system protein J
MSAPLPRSLPCRGFTLIELLVALFITAIIFAMGYGAINQALNDHESLTKRQDRLTAVQTAMRVMVQDFGQLAPRPVRDQIGTNSLPSLLARPTGGSLGDSGSGSLGGGNALGTSMTVVGSSSSPSSSSTSSTTSSSTSGPSTSNSGSSTSLSLGGSSSLSLGTTSGNTDSGGNDLVSFTRAGWANPAGIQRPALERVSYRLEDGVLRRLHWPVLDVTEATAPIRRDLLDHVKSVRFRYLTDARQWIDQWPPTGSGTGSAVGDPSLRMRPFAVEVTLELEDWGRIVRIIEVPT